MQTSTSHSPIYNPSQTNPAVVHPNLPQSNLQDVTATSTTLPQVAPPPNLFIPGSLPPTALASLFNAQSQQLPFPGVAHALSGNFPIPPWMQPAAAAASGQTQPFQILQQHQQQQQQQQQPRPLLMHTPVDDQQMRSRQTGGDFSHNMSNQFQQPYSSANSHINQQRTKLREPYLRVKNLSRKYSYRDVKLLFADYKLRLEDIKMINNQSGERTGKKNSNRNFS